MSTLPCGEDCLTSSELSKVFYWKCWYLRTGLVCHGSAIARFGHAAVIGVAVGARILCGSLVMCHDVGNQDHTYPVALMLDERGFAPIQANVLELPNRR